MNNKENVKFTSELICGAMTHQIAGITDRVRSRAFWECLLREAPEELLPLLISRAIIRGRVFMAAGDIRFPVEPEPKADMFADFREELEKAEKRELMCIALKSQLSGEVDEVRITEFWKAFLRLSSRELLAEVLTEVIHECSKKVRCG
ncbi:hypothetical protein KJE01_23210 [Escherichia marmotae]|uniref:hypothetical protein n=1 Tax=Escherichia TaxID=561 RepID=UPI00022428BB|nr:MULTISPECIES: hypothetical protein [Escherichia]EES3797923.1 hypothetical protein [Escherichia coli]EFC9844749.1 hypothetical protein [Escherichia coli]EFG2176058.1 hypothetical protein [Escherichia coli]EFJ5715406.1 hypothetical protein [Escherichia coli]EFK1933430.1 hypothetical protein [Escherichia coli]